MARKSGSHSQITGPRIKQAALRLFAAEGYAAVSMRQIAKDVGVQVGMIGQGAGTQCLYFTFHDRCPGFDDPVGMPGPVPSPGTGEERLHRCRI